VHILAFADKPDVDAQLCRLALQGLAFLAIPDELKRARVTAGLQAAHSLQQVPVPLVLPEVRRAEHDRIGGLDRGGRTGANACSGRPL
jgi:hypothetical protein